MDDVIDATPVAPKTTIDVFVVMYRYSNDYWSACSTWTTLEAAQQSIGTDQSIQAWKIVKVSGLPISVNAGEA